MIIGSAEWYDARTDLFEGMPDDIWHRAEKAAMRWILNKADIFVWDNSIRRCRVQHPSYSIDEIRQAFECARDDVLGEFGGDDLIY